MKMLTKDQILESKDVEEKIVEVPEWGGSVKVRGISLAKRIAMLNGALDSITGKIDTEKMLLLTFIECVIEPKFTVMDYVALKEKSATAMDKVINAINAASGQATTEEELEVNKKNSEETPKS